MKRLKVWAVAAAAMFGLCGSVLAVPLLQFYQPSNWLLVYTIEPSNPFPDIDGNVDWDNYWPLVEHLTIQVFVETENGYEAILGL